MKASSYIQQRARRVLALALTLTLLTWAVAAFGQSVVSGDMQGLVTDPSGAAVPGATVTIRNVQTGESQTATSNPSGNYRFSFLKPGTYSVTATASGFNELRRNVVVAVGQSTTTNLALGVAAQSQTVEV